MKGAIQIFDRFHEIVNERVRSSLDERFCYASDASQIEGLPDFVIRPKSTEEVSRILMICNEFEIPVTARGAGTGLAGGATPVKGGVVLDMSSMNNIIEFDIENLQVIVEPGVVPEKLNRTLKSSGFFFPPDPGSSAICTIGGMISNNSSGIHCIKYGTTRNYVLDLQVVLADGRVINTGSKVLKSSVGYDLTRLFVGSEGTLGIITRAGLKIMPLPIAKRLVVASFDSAVIAGKVVIQIFSAGIIPSACEILDNTTIAVLKRCDPNLVFPNLGDIILFEVDGTDNSTAEQSYRIIEICAPLAQSIREVSSKTEMGAIWEARRLVGAAISRLDPTKTRVYAGEDVGVPIKQIPILIKKIQEISEEFDIPAMKYGHIGDGSLHVALFIDIMDPDQWERLKRAQEKIHRTAIELGGTVSSEHGVGLARAIYMRDQLGNDFLEIMQSIKRTFDPKGILNPGKLSL
ncbi:MAG: FAD-binding protein [Methanotrichaceae archaeon]|nr:FAD-binding protein [Methanotrichaceae archaeon]